MDMRKILQAVDGVTTKAEVNSSDMKTFLTIVEGRGPLNRTTSAEAIAMQHYAEPAVTAVTENIAPSLISKYFTAVEQELKEAAAKPNERARHLAERVIERITPNADGSLPDPSINRLTGKPNPPAAEPAPTSVKPSGSTVEYGGSTYNVVGVFGDGIRPRIGMSGKVIPAKAYVVGDKMYVLLDTPAQEGVVEDDAGDVEQRMIAKIEKEKQRLAKLKQTDPEAYKREMAKRKTSSRVPPVSTFEDQDVAEVAGPEKCWPGHRKVGTQPGTGKNAGKRVNDCEKIKPAGKK